MSHEELMRKEAGAVAPVTSLTLPLGHQQLTSTRSLAYATPARFVEVCFVAAGTVAASSANLLVEMELPVLDRCVRHTPMRQSTVAALS